MAPLEYCFGAAGEAIGVGSFASLLLVGTALAMKAPTTGMLTHQGWPVRAAGLARVWAFPSRVGAMPDQPREKLLDVVTFSSLLRGWWQRWGSLARECPVAGGHGLVSPPGGCSAVSCTGGGSVLRGCPTRDLSRLPQHHPGWQSLLGSSVSSLQPSQGMPRCGRGVHCRGRGHQLPGTAKLPSTDCH